MREEIAFPSAGSTCRGWFYRPEGHGSIPVIVMAHGLGGVKEMRLDAYASRFCDEGYACLVFDYRHFGDSGGEPRQLLDIRRQQEDWMAAMAFARGQEAIDPNRLVLWGTSFSGGHVLHAGAEDRNVAAVISQCPFTDGFASMGAMSPSTLVRVSFLALLDGLAALTHRPPVRVPLAGPPGSAALMTAPDVLSGYRALLPEGLEFDEEVAARIAMHVPFYRPGKRASRVDCPVLFLICEEDSVAPARASLRHARKAPKGEIEIFPVGHFDIYRGEAFERAVERQIRFLRENVPEHDSFTLPGGDRCSA